MTAIKHKEHNVFPCAPTNPTLVGAYIKNPSRRHRLPGVASYGITAVIAVKFVGRIARLRARRPHFPQARNRGLARHGGSRRRFREVRHSAA